MKIIIDESVDYLIVKALKNENLSINFIFESKLPPLFLKERRAGEVS